MATWRAEREDLGVMPVGLDDVRALAATESGLAVVVTSRLDGSPHASVVNAGVIDHPVGGEPVVAFVVRGYAKKLTHLRATPRATVVFRSGWDWVAVEGDTELAGPDDVLEGVEDVPLLLRTVYAGAVGGSAEDWRALDDEMASERHTAALVRPAHVYANRAEGAAT